MRSIQWMGCIFAGMFLTACGAQVTPVPEATTAGPTKTPTRLVVPRPTATPRPAGTYTSPVAPSSTLAVNTCPEDWSQLNVNGLAKVAGDENDAPNRVRSEPVTGDNIITQIDPGTIMRIIAGPVCTDDLYFWLVESSAIPGGTGWTAEGDGNDYWLEPYTDLPEWVRLSASGVSFIVPEGWSNTPQVEIVPAGSDPYCSWPEHIKIRLTAYPAQSAWHPVIHVYTTAAMPGWYPICPGAPLLRVQQQVLSSGERVLFGSKNAQPIYNSELIYSYEGVSSDGTHTIFAFLPVNYPYLAYSYENPLLPQGGVPFDLQNQDWTAYYRAVGEQLEAAGDSDFTPGLDLLDALVGSITVATP